MSFWGKVGSFASGLSQGLPVGAQIGEGIVGSYERARAGKLAEEQQVKDNEFRANEAALRGREVALSESQAKYMQDRNVTNDRNALQSAISAAQTGDELNTLASQADSANWPDIAAAARNAAANRPSRADVEAMGRARDIASLGVGAEGGLSQYTAEGASPVVQQYAQGLATGLAGVADRQAQQRAAQEAAAARDAARNARREAGYAAFNAALSGGNYLSAVQLADELEIPISTAQKASWTKRGDRKEGYDSITDEDRDLSLTIFQDAEKAVDKRISDEAIDPTKRAAARAQYLTERLQSVNPMLKPGTRFLDPDIQASGRMNSVINKARSLFENGADPQKISSYVDMVSDRNGFTQSQRLAIGNELIDAGVFTEDMIGSAAEPVPNPLAPAPTQPEAPAPRPGFLGTGLQFGISPGGPSMPSISKYKRPPSMNAALGR